jgi:uncharacterized protein
MNVGQWNTLKILRGTSVGLYLGDEAGQDVLLPHKYIPEDAVVGMDINVFIYRDSEDRLIATNLKPAIELGEYGLLEVVATSKFGAFLDWGLEKDLFVPFREQNQKLREGDYTPVYLYLDQETDRLVASCKVNKFFKNNEAIDLEEGQEVDILLFENTDLGFNVIINNLYKGLLYTSEIFGRLGWGDRTKGFIKKIREDGKIDVALKPENTVKNLETDAELLLQALIKNQGELAVGDKSEPSEIADLLSMSKKAFKRAAGILYKAKKIEVFADKVKLIQTETQTKDKT